MTHKSVGAIIERGGKFLLLDRVNPPFGFAGPAGHVDDGETADQAIDREVLEETGLVVTNQELLLAEMVEWNECKEGVKGHYWYVFRCETSGEVTQAKDEAKSLAWYARDQIKKLTLEPVWKYWLEKLGII